MRRRERSQELQKGADMYQSVFEDRGNWYKGNLHMHTTRSDGHASPKDAVERYRRNGYDFIALTDHRRPSVTLEPGEHGNVDALGREDAGSLVDAGNMLLLSGVEWDTGGANTRRDGDVATYHILGIGMTEFRGICYERNPHPKPQEIVNAIRADGGLAILAHPAWSVMDPGGIAQLEGITAAEIYNAVSDLPYTGQRAESSAWFDIWGTHYEKLVPAVASDDAHSYEGDACYAYTMVNAAELSREGILDALQAGNFYATQRPVLYDMAIDREKGAVHLEFSKDVMTAVFYSNHIWTEGRVAQVKGGKADYRLEAGEFFLRAELITRDGRKAWTSPVPVAG